MVRQAGIVSLIALTTFLFCGAASPEGCQPQQESIGPSKGEVIGVGVAAVGVITIATVVLVKVHNGHHTVKGCVHSGPNGLEVETSDKKIYSLSGDTLKVKEGDLVQMHGDKIKKTKDGNGEETFMVQAMKKDFGPCSISSAPAAAGTGAKQ